MKNKNKIKKRTKGNHFFQKKIKKSQNRKKVARWEEIRTLRYYTMGVRSKTGGVNRHSSQGRLQ